MQGALTTHSTSICAERTHWQTLRAEFLDVRSPNEVNLVNNRAWVEWDGSTARKKGSRTNPFAVLGLADRRTERTRLPSRTKNCHESPILLCKTS